MTEQRDRITINGVVSRIEVHNSYYSRNDKQTVISVENTDTSEEISGISVPSTWTNVRLMEHVTITVERWHDERS